MGQPPTTHSQASESARTVSHLILEALNRQMGILKDIDEKANYLGAGGLVLTAGFIAAIATRTPNTQFVQYLAAGAMAVDVAAVMAVLFTWWPMTVLADPHPAGLLSHHFDEDELELLRTVAVYGSEAYAKNQPTLKRKNRGIKASILCLLIGIPASAATVAASILLEVHK